jgi:hypothetical protein
LFDFSEQLKLGSLAPFTKNLLPFPLVPKIGGSMSKISIIFMCITGMFFTTLSADERAERPYTFSLGQEKILASNPKVLSFLYHMTRNQLDFDAMAQKYHLTSTPKYYAFLIEHGLMNIVENGRIEFSFLNPYGAWKLHNKEDLKESVIGQLRKAGIDRLEAVIGQKPVNVDEEMSPVWIMNTYRLTLEEYKAYKQELRQISKKYTDLAEHNLFSGAEHRVIWVVQLADCIDSETAETSHLLFGPVDEF